MYNIETNLMRSTVNFQKQVQGLWGVRWTCILQPIQCYVATTWEIGHVIGRYCNNGGADSQVGPMEH